MKLISREKIVCGIKVDGEFIYKFLEIYVPDNGEAGFSRLVDA